MHQGDDAAPFLTAPQSAVPARRMDLRQGRVGLRQDLADQGDQRALAVWPRRHRLPGGRQDLLCRAGREAAAALAEGARLPAGCRRTTIRTCSVAAALHKAGLGEFIEYLGDETRATERPGTRCFRAGRSRSWSSPASCCSSRGCCSSTRRPARSTRRQDRLPPGDQGQLPARHRDQRHARGGPAEIGDGRRVLRQRAQHCRRRGDEDAAGRRACRPNSPTIVAQATQPAEARRLRLPVGLKLRWRRV